MTNSATRVCQNCKASFEIDASDFDFYKKIAVPPPTFCPRCRLQRRLIWTNLVNLFKRPCDLCKKDSISVYAPGAPYKVYCSRCWWSDNWDPFEYGRDYDFSRPFFEQFNELLHEAPLLGLSIDSPTSQSSPYTNHAGYLKNCYLLFWADTNEDCAYGAYVLQSRALLDCSFLILCETSYDLRHAYKTSRSVGSYDLVESINCAFMRDSENCQDCFASANLRNKKYYVFNKPYTKEEYFKEIKKWDLGSYKTYQEVKKLAEAHWKNFPPKPIYEKFTSDCTGNRVYQSKNCKECFEVAGVENGKYLIMMYQPPVKDCMDVSGWGNNLQMSYESGVVGENASNIRFCQEAGIELLNAEYSKLSTGGSNHFGCVSLKKGDYCTLNKRYDEKSFGELRAKIIAHMNEKPYFSQRANGKEQIAYRYGEFFPPEMSPFAYNETLANKFLPLSEKEAGEQGFVWREADIREYAITKPASELPDHIKDAPENITKEVIGCSTCPRGFKLIQFELDFLKKMNLPLPRRCPFCRINERLDQWVKQARLSKRNCDKCGAEFDTQHIKEEVPKIWCKKCYLEEVT